MSAAVMMMVGVVVGMVSAVVVSGVMFAVLAASFCVFAALAFFPTRFRMFMGMRAFLVLMRVMPGTGMMISVMMMMVSGVMRVMRGMVMSPLPRVVMGMVVVMGGR